MSLLNWLHPKRNRQSSTRRQITRKRTLGFEQMEERLTPSALGFDYPIGPPDALPRCPGTAQCSYGWQNVQDFGVNNHLGEDWNFGYGSADLWLPVFAIAAGVVTYAHDTGIGEWKGVVMIRHQGSDLQVPGGSPVSTVESMYAHLDVSTINGWVADGAAVARGQQIGRIGTTPLGSTGPHLHFELRTQAGLGLGPGYSSNRAGWTDPSNFIDANRPTQRPDLDPYSVSAPSSAIRGSTVSVFTDVDNKGSGPTGNFNVGYYLSNDGAITTSDMLLKTVTRPNIAPGTYQQWNESVTLPATLAPGTYFLGVITDPTNSLVESNEANNAQSAWSTTTVTAPSAIDLDPYAVDGPSNALRGSTVFVFTDVDNKGSSPSGTFTVGYYLSSDATVTSSDTLLKTVSRSSINGGTYQQWTESVTLPSGIAAGTYYLGVIADPFNAIAETNESNNSQADSSSITITAATAIDLDPYTVSGPSSALRGSTVSVFTDIDNKGTSPSGSFTVSYYLSSNTTINSSDILLKTVTRSTIAGGSYQQWTESVVLPASLTPGTYYIGVIADPSNTITETDEFNNAQAASSPISVTAPATVDLDPYNISCPGVAQRGATISVFTDIDNKGTGPSGSFTVRYYLSSNSQVNTADILLKTVTWSSIAGGAYHQRTESVVLPSWLTPGTYYLGVIVDPFNEIAETNESNNVQVANTVISVLS